MKIYKIIYRDLNPGETILKTDEYLRCSDNKWVSISISSIYDEIYNINKHSRCRRKVKIYITEWVNI